MKQGDMKPNFELQLESVSDDVTFITLRLGAAETDVLSLSLQDARNLAYALIQHVHLAEVRRSLERTAEKQTDSSSRGKQ